MTIIIVGCGGTGSNLAPMLSRMLDNTKFILVDGDLVEAKNITRQTFQTFDIGSNKARALAKKLNSNFENIHYSLDRYIESKDDILKLVSLNDTVIADDYIICGCVDNNASRLILEDLYTELKKTCNVHYLDSGNEDTYGTVICDSYRSELEEMKNDDHPAHHCGELIAEGNLQQYQINLDMALAIAKVVFAIVQHKEFPSFIKINGFERTAI